MELTHKWETLGLKAPFTFVRHFKEHSTCICGHAILNNYECVDALGRTFIVGSDCVGKLNDVRLERQVKAVVKAVEKKKRDDARIERLNAQREAYAQREALRLENFNAQRELNIAKFHAEYPDYSEAFNFCYSDENAPSYAQSIAQSIANWGKVSPKQLQCVYDAYRVREVANIPQSPCPTGLMVITGTILSTKWQSSPYYGHSGTLKMVVMDDRGFKVYGTVPASLDNGEELKGQRVTLTATVTPSHNDENFGFYSRPKNSKFCN